MTRVWPGVFMACVAIAAGCSPAEMTIHGLPPLPPGLSDAEPPIRRELERLQANALGAVEDPALAATVRAARVGDLGVSYLAHGFYGPGRDAFAIAAAIDPAQFRWFYYLGHATRRTGDMEGAASAFDRALAIDPGSLAAGLWLAETRLHREQLDQAEVGFTRALEQDPHCAQAMTGLGRIALSRGDHESAVDHLEQALEHRPDSPPARYALALTLRRLGRIDEARVERALLRGENHSLIITCFEDPWIQEVRRRATGTRAHEDRAIRARADGLPATALAELQAAVRANPNRYPARYDIAGLLLQLGRLDEARSVLEDLIVERPDYAAPLALLAQLESEAGRWERVEALLERAIAADPESEQTRRLQGDLLRRQGRLPAALEAYTRALELNPASSAAIVGYAVCLVRLGRPLEAERFLERQRLALPSRRQLPPAQVTVLLGLDQIDQAVAIARSAVTDHPTIASVEALALALAHASRFDEAVTWQQRALAAMPVDLSWSTHRERAAERLAAYRTGRRVSASLNPLSIQAFNLTQPAGGTASTPNNTTSNTANNNTPNSAPEQTVSEDPSP